MTDLPDLPAPPPLLLTRAAILAGTVRQVALQMPGMVVLSDAELDASIAATLARQPQPGGDVWIFGYGSLIWNPAFEHDETQLGSIAGWHRKFCLWTNLTRGCQRQPGLTLGLDRGGACRGVLFRIPRAQAEMELSVLWRREMVGGAYVPRWVQAATAQGPVDAITFTINHAHPRYAGKLDAAEMVRVIACASGTLGRCSEYLFKTEASLLALGIRDRRLEALCRQVEAAIGREA
jgi:glutathione-specific gamma-glutamylcyclotransferase